MKCPGPYGINFKFIKLFWHLLKDDAMQFLVEFHQHGVLPRGSDFSFITLIPKVNEPQSLGDFRPVSLVGCMYKILAKILANRLKRVLYGVIDKRQSAFIGGRNLVYSVVVGNGSY